MVDNGEETVSRYAVGRFFQTNATGASKQACTRRRGRRKKKGSSSVPLVAPPKEPRNSVVVARWEACLPGRDAGRQTRASIPVSGDRGQGRAEGPGIQSGGKRKEEKKQGLRSSSTVGDLSTYVGIKVRQSKLMAGLGAGWTGTCARAPTLVDGNRPSFKLRLRWFFDDGGFCPTTWVRCRDLVPTQAGPPGPCMGVEPAASPGTPGR